jgi:hypothetical protein
MVNGNPAISYYDNGKGDLKYAILSLASTEARLAGLTLSQGTLTPVFSSTTFAYTATVANSVASVTVTPTVLDASATVTVNDLAVASGTPSGAIALSVGAKTITAVGTAQDGVTTQTYTVEVTRQTAYETWAAAYGLTGPNAGPAGDYNGDGETNEFERVAGLDPIDPAARFNLRVERVAGEPGQKKIIFSPLMAGRTYLVKAKASLTDPVWTPLTSFTTSDLGGERTVTDLVAGSEHEFYQVEITLP